MVRRARWIGAALGVAFALASPGAQSPQPSEALASLLALQTAWNLTSSAVKWPFQWTEGEADELTQTLQLYGQLIHRALVARSQADPRYAGMATTITGAVESPGSSVPSSSS